MSIQLTSNKDLQSLNTFGIKCFAKYFAEVYSEQDLIEIFENHNDELKDAFVLGGGSNVLFTSNIDGFVVKNSIPGIDVLNETDNNVVLRSNAGVVWHDLVLYAVDHGWGGIENLSLIPGQVGAAPMQNIGAYGVEIKDVFKSLNAFNIQSGEMHSFSKEDCEFGYRDSVFKSKYKGKYIITSVDLQLSKRPSFNTSYGAIVDTLHKMNVEELSLKAISEAVIAIRSAKLPDPKVIGNAGSFFKNPIISLEEFNVLKESYPNVPSYPAPNGIKVPAGWLIEQCGWKGKRVGNTGSYKNQALVLINHGEASGEEIHKLAMDIKASVKDKFGVTIEAEVNII